MYVMASFYLVSPQPCFLQPQEQSDFEVGVCCTVDFIYVVLNKSLLCNSDYDACLLCFRENIILFIHAALEKD